MTKDIYDLLTEKYSDVMRQVFKLHTNRALRRSEIEELVEISNKLGYKATYSTCASCVYNFILKIACDYYAYKERIDRREINKEGYSESKENDKKRERKVRDSKEKGKKGVSKTRQKGDTSSKTGSK